MTRALRVFDDRMPSCDEIKNANELRKLLASQFRENEPVRFKAVLDGSQRNDLVLMPALASALLDLLRHVGSGRSVVVMPTDEMLTTQKAADLLNVSRPYLCRLIDSDVIPHTMVGRHRRVRAEDVFDYKRKRDEQRDAALSELAEVDAALI